jgi:hypothetical protein|tara:strand:+ start:103 stop:843 length:741 start_codon:yes stop_codon:yes gene_type:complete
MNKNEVIHKLSEKIAKLEQELYTTKEELLNIYTEQSNVIVEEDTISQTEEVISQTEEEEEEEDQLLDNEVKYDDNISLDEQKEKYVLFFMNYWFGLNDSVKCDDDGLFDGMTLPVPHARFIWRLSWLSLIGGIYAVYRGYYELSWFPLVGFLTSVNYWRNPVSESFGRYIDIVCISSGIIYTAVRAQRSQRMVEYYIVLAIGLAFFFSGKYFGKEATIGTFCHAGAHLFGDLSNIVLYTGYVPPLY